MDPGNGPLEDELPPQSTCFQVRDSILIFPGVPILPNGTTCSLTPIQASLRHHLQKECKLEAAVHLPCELA